MKTLTRITKHRDRLLSKELDEIRRRLNLLSNQKTGGVTNVVNTEVVTTNTTQTTNITPESETHYAYVWDGVSPSSYVLADDCYVLYVTNGGALDVGATITLPEVAVGHEITIFMGDDTYVDLIPSLGETMRYPDIYNGGLSTGLTTYNFGVGSGRCVIKCSPTKDVANDWTISDHL